MKLKSKLQWLLNPGQTLSQRVIHGSFWVFISQGLYRGLGFIRTVVLARLLAPNDFGLVGIAFVVMSLLETFSEIGIETALIHKKGNINEYLDIAWTIKLIRGLILFLFLFLLAPLIANFFMLKKQKMLFK